MPAYEKKLTYFGVHRNTLLVSRNTLVLCWHMSVYSRTGLGLKIFLNMQSIKKYKNTFPLCFSYVGGTFRRRKRSNEWHKIVLTCMLQAPIYTHDSRRMLAVIHVIHIILNTQAAETAPASAGLPRRFDPSLLDGTCSAIFHISILHANKFIALKRHRLSADV